MQIYVGGLLGSVTEESLTEIFKPFGEILRISIPRDYKTDRPRGYAFVVLANEEQGRAAILGLDGKDFNGRILRVSRAFNRGPAAEKR